MVFYFSGTGNSLWVATQIGSAFGEDLISIADELNNKDNSFIYEVKKDEKIIFVYPVHSWGPAVLVPRFIKRIKLSGYNNQPVFSISTCGDNCGYTSKIIAKNLKKRSIFLTKAYSVQMPNNYILMSGFDTDPKEVEKEKLKKAPELVNIIVENIKNHSKEELYTVGTSPFLKSKIVYPLFSKFAIGKNSFYAKDNCISCKLCVNICPTKTIKFENNRPEWGNSCVQCTACIQRCPVNAIEYGKVSLNKGRYHHPDI